MASTHRSPSNQQPSPQSNPLIRKKPQRATQHRTADATIEQISWPSPPDPLDPSPARATLPRVQPAPQLVSAAPQPAQPPAPLSDVAIGTVGPAKITPLSLGLRILLDILLIGAAVFVLRRPDPPAIALQPPPAPAPTATATLMPTPAPITVFVSGAVHSPALYQLPPSARVGDAIARAGGLLPAADASLINQAAELYDGAQVHVPVPAASAPDQVVAVQPAAGVSGAPSAPAANASNSGGRININTASASELTALPGIGQAKAENIIAGRPYDTVDDLERVSGIGAKTVDQLRDLVTVQ